MSASRLLKKKEAIRRTHTVSYMTKLIGTGAVKRRRKLSSLIVAML